MTNGSDDDFMVLVHGPEGSPVKPEVEEVSEVLDHQPGKEGPFAEAVFSEKLVQHIGLDPDNNRNLTRRMLFLLESVSLTGAEVYREVRDELLARYFDESIKPYQPPRFLLNEVVRYWRTIGVDFAGKEWEGPEKWGLRNAKLRTSRKILFAGGLLPALECFRFDSAPMRSYLEGQLAMPPTDRIAQAFMKNRAIDEGVRTLSAYDQFVGRMNDPDFRQALQQVNRDNAADSEAFDEACAIGKELQAGLLALLYEAPTELPRVAREYAIF
ncbi:MAG TPA: hypothetical protein VGV69_05900 [Solirubrobacterales bacterium]|nr:hypothetical protein [Solirubrobacterales bacterium]